MLSSAFLLPVHYFDSVVLFTRIDESKDKIRGVLKGRLPLEKDMKKEIVQALRSRFHLIYCLFILIECFSNNLRSLDEDLKKGWLLYVLRSFHIYKFL